MSDAATIALEAIAAWSINKPAPTYVEYSRNIRISLGGGRFIQYDPTSDRCQQYLLDQMDLGIWERFYVCAPPQWGGKTLTCILVPALRNAIACGLPVGYGLPTFDSLDKAWSEKLKPAIVSGGFGGYLPKTGPGARGGRGPTLSFHDPDTGEPQGRLVFMAGAAFGSTAAVVLIDEVDQMRKDDGTPLWSVLEDMFNRANSFRERALRIAVGTVEHDDNSIILNLINEDGTGTRPWLRCPHCGHYQIVTGEQLHYDATDEIAAAETARIRCVGCSALWDESQRQDAISQCIFAHRGQTVEAGEVKGDSPRTRKLGLLWTAYDSSLARLSIIAVEHLRASRERERGNHELMRKFVRYRECRTYNDDKEDMEQAGPLTWQSLSNRASKDPFGPVRKVTDRSETETGHLYSRHVTEPPKDAIGCCAGVDVQHNRLYWVLTAYDRAGTEWDVGWGYEYNRADQQPGNVAETHATLDRLNIVLNQLAGEIGMKWIGCDIGDRADILKPWIGGHRGKWMAVKGHKGDVASHPKIQFGDIEGMVYPRSGEILILNSNVRDVLHAALRRDIKTPGAHHIPHGIGLQDRHYLSHLLSEQSALDPKTKKKKTAYGPGRNDWLDARIYAKALIMLALRETKPKGPPRKYGVIGSV